MRRTHKINAASHDKDIVLWAKQQAHFLQDGDWGRLDVPHLIDEILALARDEMKTLRSNMIILIARLLEWVFQPQKRNPSWLNSIEEHKDRISLQLKEVPSLQQTIRDKEWLQITWEYATRYAKRETHKELSVFPPRPIWSVRQMLQEGWMPENSSKNN